MDQPVDFKEVLDNFNKLSETAKVTLFQRLVNATDKPQTLRTVIRYSCIKLDRINSRQPKGSPGRTRYETYKELRKNRKPTP